MSAACNHIRQEKRKEIHEPFLESKSTGVEHLTSGQFTAYLWMKRVVHPRKDERVFPSTVSVSLKVERAIAVFLLISAHKYNL